MNKIIAHHGSPGTTEDFKDLKNIMTDFDWTCVDRYKGFGGRSDEEAIQLGYSFGCVYALMAAAGNPQKTQAVVLIAPYLFVKKKLPAPLKILLGTPVLGNLLLSKMAPKSIEKMLVESSYPATPPPHYRALAPKLAAPHVLKPALYEKELDESNLIISIERIKAAGVPVIVIRGEGDRTSPKEQFQKLKNLIDYREIVIKGAGHALLWSHPEAIAKELTGLLKFAAAGEQESQTQIKSDRPFGHYEGKHVLNNVSAFLSKHVQEIPDRKILTWVPPERLASWTGDLSDPLPHDSITVRELDALVGRIAAGLKAMGLGSGDRVIIFIPMSLYLYAAMFAVQKIGAIATFLDSWARRDQMGVAAGVVDAAAMISVEKAFVYLGEVPQIAKIPIKIVAGPCEGSYSARLEELMQTPQYASAEALEKEHSALITFTTGSSGTPKGADRTHRFLAAQHYALNRHIPYAADDADLPVFPIFSLNNLAAGVTTVIPAIDVGVPSDKDAPILIAQMMATNTTCTTLSPSLLRSVYNFCRSADIKLPFLKRIVTGGAPISRDDLIATVDIAPNAEVLVLYGSTEVEPMAHIEAREMIAQIGSDDPEWVDEGVNVGKFDEGLSVKFLKIEKGPITVSSAEDWKKLEVPNGEVGEIVVSGEHVCENYFNNPEAFSRAKIRDESGVVWHRTGDLGRTDDNGNLWLVGRFHNAINRGGTYQFPVRAEIILKKLSFVDKAAFLGMPDQELGEKTYAVYSSHANDPDYQRSEIERIMRKNGVLVDKIVKVDDIPMDPRHHSKVEYDVLRRTLQKEGA